MPAFDQQKSKRREPAKQERQKDGPGPSPALQTGQPVDLHLTGNPYHIIIQSVSEQETKQKYGEFLGVPD